MRSADYTEDMILAAGSRLREQGVEINGWQLREALGGGNAKRLFSIWQRHNPVDPVVQSVTLPDSIKDSVKSLMAGLESQLMAMVGNLYVDMADKANAKVVEAHQLLDQVRSAADEESEKAYREIERQDQLLDEKDHQLKALTSEHGDVCQTLEQNLVKLARLEEQSSAATLKLTEAASRIDLLTRENERLIEVTSVQSSALSASQQEATDLRSFLETRTEELNTARRSDQASREREAHASTQAATLERLRSDDQILIAKLQLNFSHSEKICGGLEARLEGALGQIESLERLTASTKEELEAYKAAVTDLLAKGVDVQITPAKPKGSLPPAGSGGKGSKSSPKKSERPS